MMRYSDYFCNFAADSVFQNGKLFGAENKKKFSKTDNFSWKESEINI